MIDISDIKFQFNTTPIFEHFSWQVQKGESWVILGPSGCGKSTLLSLLAGLLLPNSGTIKINNALLSRPRPQTGLILQDYGLLPWANVHQNASLGLTVRKFYGSDGIHSPQEPTNASSVPFWLKRLGLTDIETKYPSQISGGQRQRTAIARTLVLNPDLLLMDEPFSSLDAPTREGLQLLTQELVSEQGLTLVLVTHAIEEAAILGKKILMLRQPTNTNTVIVENPKAGSINFRESTEYFTLIKELRNLMELERGSKI